MSSNAEQRAQSRSATLSEALEGVRTRLTLLATSLADFQTLVATEVPMPPVEKLQARAAQVASNMAAVTNYLAERHAVLAEASVFPLPAYPGRTEGGMLAALLRKKLDPRVEDWLDQAWKSGRDGCGVDAGAASAVAINGGGGGGGGGDPTAAAISVAEWQEAWKGLSAAMADAIFEKGAGLLVVDYTRAETDRGVENVRTGLKRKLVKMSEKPIKIGGRDDDDIEMDEESEDEEEDEESEDEDDERHEGESQGPAQPLMPINDYLKITLGLQNPETGDLVIKGITR